jgi:hypothetical protein
MSGPASVPGSASSVDDWCRRPPWILYATLAMHTREAFEYQHGVIGWISSS